ncbi:DUF4870 domain-containing protein [Arenivirga flava]|uniref:DUF4870 domain-containing protein n=1 Tax=Arenivirga flava TaxID=1930060 RepID=A0AA37X817_9MICO|nr:DUF4870 domain-containing protein [Arenivirga flava]GMA27014.1 hypothetical protein GCM10025874_02670 [Arenivirga flava]
MSEPTPTTASVPVPSPAFGAETDRTVALAAHLGGILGPLPALILFLAFRDRGPLVREESKEALNWQITWCLAALAVQVSLVGVVGGLFAALLPGFGWTVQALLSLVPWLLYLVNVALSVVGGIRMGQGAPGYRYPFAVRLLK